jgi:hypothetical protein
MNMKTIFLLLFIFSMGSVYSQTVRVNAGYSHLYSPQLDRAIKTYNFSRPNLTQEQPFIQHGGLLSVAVFYNSERNFKSGIGVNSGFYLSSANNPNAEDSFNYRMFDLGYLLNYTSQSGKLYGEFGVFATAGSLIKRLNGEQFQSDGQNVHSLQIGGLINLNMSYLIPVNDRFKLAPFISANFAPYFSEGTSESVINQTSTLQDEEYTTFFRFEIGCSIHYESLKK